MDWPFGFTDSALGLLGDPILHFLFPLLVIELAEGFVLLEHLLVEFVVSIVLVYDSQLLVHVDDLLRREADDQLGDPVGDEVPGRALLLELRHGVVDVVVCYDRLYVCDLLVVQFEWLQFLFLLGGVLLDPLTLHCLFGFDSIVQVLLFIFVGL